jgi:hypothetical protein
VSGELVALLLTFGVHVAGAVVLVTMILRNSDVDWRSWWPRDDDDGGSPPPEPPPAPTGGGDGLPLPDAAPSPHRFRSGGRLADAYPPPERRPAHVPAPAPREPAPS